jgi:hypothetical protein
VWDLLATWEAGLSADDGRRAVLLLALAHPAVEVDELLGVTVGARDTELLALRRALFGDQMALRTDCPDCGVDMEFELDVDTLIDVGLATAAPDGPHGESRPLCEGSDLPHDVEIDEWRVRFRLPTQADLLAAAAGPTADAGEARWTLLARCVLEATRSGEAVDITDLPSVAQERVAEAAAAADPAADIRLNVPCLDCGRQAKPMLDVVVYLWAELDAWARATLLDVHLLAATYGWTEGDVLALSPLRRQHYLELAGHA